MEEDLAMEIIDGGVTAVQGFKASGLHCGIKRSKADLALIFSEKEATAAGVFTQNVVKAAPVILTMEHLSSGRARAVVVNSGNANACTGERGMSDAKKMAELTADALGIKPQEVVVASTGVIGVPLPMDKIQRGIYEAAEKLSADGGPTAAEAIMTTDTYPKKFAVRCDIDGTPITVGGIAKGSGMIHPNMATMLAFITTDVAVSPKMLRKALKSAVDKSFNMITVDGDTSTNDMVVVLANGLSKIPIIDAETPAYFKFLKTLERVCLELAKEIVRDGEGATKFVEIEVLGASSIEGARKLALSVATSNLVKTALFGEDANWGRILAACGKAGVEFNPSKVDIFLQSKVGTEQTARGGMGLPFSEENASRILAEKEIKIIINLNDGESSVKAWTCDLSYEYVRINASYRT
ncbi:MAG: Arginine biosynthesis bifunctional protein ArgJ [Clostridia bacterium 41_269]|nr:MAG: Arginine biosynthesis bifunctional protein ArgJ [Clostridia bacterium 41_269]